MVRCELEKQFLSQNVHSLNHDKEEELIDFMCTNNIFACGIQETWRLGSDITENNGFVVVQHGCEQKRRLKGRTSGNMAIILSPDAKKAWNLTESHCDSAELIRNERIFIITILSFRNSCSTVEYP